MVYPCCRFILDILIVYYYRILLHLTQLSMKNTRHALLTIIIFCYVLLLYTIIHDSVFLLHFIFVHYYCIS